ncbi:MAG: hypothetical protein ACJARD_001249 [Alphaproteobacteria bacterium]|jgi:hypothetical protein
MSKIKHRDHKRARQTKNINYKIVIICEDTKNAVKYFKALLTDWNLWKVSVVIDGSSDSAPISVYNYAVNNYKHIYTKKGKRVYCLIDKDDHPTFLSTLAKENEIDNIYILESVPCFELWILLHFQVSFTYDNRHMLYKQLKDNHQIDKDEDDYGQLYNERLKNKTDQALKNSKALLSINRDTHPAYTKIHVLIDILKNMKD